METILMQLDEDDSLQDALSKLGLVNIPSNAILDKTLPGIGATFSEIHAGRNSIIIEPNVPVITGKTKKHPDLHLFPVYEDATVPKIKAYLMDSEIKFKRFLTTPESFWKIKEAIQGTDFDLFTDFFCLFDESERLTQDVGYRKKITNPVKDFFQFQSKAFVSATPLDIHHPEVTKQNFKRYKVQPTFDYREPLQLIVTNEPLFELREILNELGSSNKVCIFFNSVKGIQRIIENIPLTDYTVFCSHEGKKKLENSEIVNVKTYFQAPISQYSLFTCRFFSAVDFDLDELTHVIIYTDLNQAEHTMIDPFTEAIQIQGRFRNKIQGKRFKSLTHITNIKRELDVISDEDIRNIIVYHKNHYDYLKKKFYEENNEAVSITIKKDIQNNTYYSLLDEEMKLDPFAVHNLYNEERVKGYYTSAEALIEAYIKSGFFILDVILKSSYVFESKRRSIQKSRLKKEKIKTLVKAIEQIQDSDIDDFRKIITPHLKETDLVIEAYRKLGKAAFESVDFDIQKIKKKLEEFENSQRKNNVEFQKEIAESFELNIHHNKNFYRDRLSAIYSNHGITDKVLQNTINDYFEIKKNNSVSSGTIKLIKFRF
ncbi:MAG TPA: hypothetical protein VFP20_00260 [Bacteroidales bacterium]|nr:hypothetical protein [Bacteroidales bacterium]